ncbi:MAG: flavodoxin domain-containing protein [Anaerolineales bacterium]
MQSKNQPEPYLVVYATNSGSTADIAQSIAQELARTGTPIDVRRVDEVMGVEPYAAVVIGGPMMIGWHRGAMRFLKRSREALVRIPVAYFFTALSLTAPENGAFTPLPLFLDPALAKPPRHPDRLSFRERFTSVENYLNPVREAAPRVRPVSAAFFAGKLDPSLLNPFQRLFVRWIIQAKPSDRRNLSAVRSWAAGLRTLFSEPRPV